MKGKNLGKVLSPESRAKISDTMKGRKFSEEHRRKIGDSWKGRKHTDDTKSKMSQSMKGKHKGMHWKLIDGKRVWY